MKNETKMILKNHEMTLINPSMYYGDKKSNSLICNAYDNNYGECYHIFVDFNKRVYTIQSLSPVTIHDVRHYKF